jgi:hypothetical protein
MTRPYLKLVSSRPGPPPAELPEVLLVRRMDEVRDIVLELPFTWLLPQTWLALYAALDRYEGQRIRTRRGRR